MIRLSLATNVGVCQSSMIVEGEADKIQKPRSLLWMSGIDRAMFNESVQILWL